jgi:hypothetical protein
MAIVQRLRSFGRRAILAAGILSLVMIAATSSSASSRFPDNFTPARSGLSDHVDLARHTIATGSTETGYLVVDNRTRTTINVTRECRPQIEGLLRGARYRQSSWSDLVCDPGPLLIRPGINRLPVAFEATYLECSQDPNKAVGTVACLDGNKAPPLPSGTYVAHVDGDGAALPVPRAITIHLTGH